VLNGALLRRRRGRRANGGELVENEARVQVDVPADREDGNPPVSNAQGGEVGAGKNRRLQLDADLDTRDAKVMGDWTHAL
jgi:hypothetical protein